jgi:F-type H+-transporting ATPase subunit b
LNINLTLVLQMLVFAVFVWFTMRFVWPPLVKAMDERQAKIAEGLAAAERGRKELELAQNRIKEDMKSAKLQAAELIDKANQRAAQIMEQTKEDARQESQRLAKVAQEQIAIEITRAKEELRQQVASLAVSGAEKILMREIDEKANHALINHLIEEL